MAGNSGADMTATDPHGVTRRAALKRGALVGGALVWAAPAMQALHLTSASAQSPSPTRPPATGKIPSHGIFIVTIGGVQYGLKFDSSSLAFDKIASPSDVLFLAAKGFQWSNPTAAVLALFANRGNGGVDAANEAALIVSLPAGATLVAGTAYTFDGGLQNCGNGDKYQAAAISGNALVFYGACHE